MRSTSVTSVLILAAAASSAAPRPDSAAARGAAPAPFIFNATGCAEPGVLVSVPIDRAAELLPDGYTPTAAIGPPGTADVLVAVAACDGLVVEGKEADGSTFSEVGIAIAPPDGSPGAHYYLLWHGSDEPKLVSRLAATGVRTAVVPRIEARVEPGQTSRFSGNVPLPLQGYAIKGEAAAPFNLPNANTWWHESADGRTIRIDYSFANLEARVGGGSVESESGSELAELLGGSSVGANAALLHFDLAATVTAFRGRNAHGSGRRGA